jgi:hypothetical protein
MRYRNAHRFFATAGILLAVLTTVSSESFGQTISVLGVTITISAPQPDSIHYVNQNVPMSTETYYSLSKSGYPEATIYCFVDGYSVDSADNSTWLARDEEYVVFPEEYEGPGSSRRKIDTGHTYTTGGSYSFENMSSWDIFGGTWGDTSDGVPFTVVNPNCN